jgi:hypothetical protein
VLALEVAATSQRLDRDKARLYARGGAAHYWLVDLVNHRLEARSEPQTGGEYGVARILGPEDQVTLPSIGRLRVADLLP